jgi:MtrB/PioB family decaheme-associated outer membrane protein
MSGRITQALTVAGAIFVLLAAPAFAADDGKDGKDPYFRDGLTGDFTIGAGGASADQKSYKFGEYTGISGDDGYFVGGGDLSYNRGSYFMNLQTEDLGLRNRSVFMETGEYGKFKVFTQFNQLPHLINNLTDSPYQNSGSTSLLLNSGFGRGATTSALNAVNRQVNIETDRQTGRYGFSGTYEGFDFGVAYRRDEKDGTLSTGAAFGSSPSPTVVRSVILPDPVSQVANEMNAVFARNGEKGQIQLNFDLSLFDNRNNSLSFQNPFSGIAGQPAVGQMSRDPDNSYYRVGLTGGYNLPYATRISGVAEYGSMRQDDTLLPYGVGSNTALLPRASAQAEINTVHGMLNLTSRPWDKLALQAKYRHYQTYNETPQQTFRYIVNDGASQVATTAALNTLPFDYNQNQADLNGTYMAFAGTTVKLGYRFDSMERSFREVRETREHMFKAGLNSNYFSFMSAGYNVSLSERSQNDSYDQGRVFNPRFASTTATFDNHPNLRRYDVADKQTVRHTANVNFFPTEKVDLGVYLNYLDDNYNRSEMGLTFSRRYDVTVDLTYSPMQNTSLYTYYTFENIESEQNSRTFAAATANDLTRNWLANHDNDTHTVGAGANVRLLGNKLTLMTDYSLSDSRENITFRTGGNSTFGNPQDLPQLKTLWHNVSATGKYRLADSMDVGLRYVFQAFQTADFATDFFNPGSQAIREVLTLAGTVPNYNAHLAMMFLTYRFGGDSIAKNNK